MTEHPPESLFEQYPWIDRHGAFEVLDWIELLATSPNANVYGARLAWFLWDLSRATTRHQLTTGNYPGMPEHSRIKTPLPPCTCPYGLHTQRIPWTSTSRYTRGHVVSCTLVLGSYFTLNPACPHHGDESVRMAQRLGINLNRWQAELIAAAARHRLTLRFR